MTLYVRVLYVTDLQVYFLSVRAGPGTGHPSKLLR